MQASRKSLLKKIIIGLISLIIIVMLAIWIFSPMVTRYVLNNQLEPMGLNLSSDSSIRYNPFATKLTIKELSILHEETSIFEINDLKLDVTLRDLIGNALTVSQFKLSGLFLKLDLDQRGLLFGKQNLLAQSQQTEPATDETEHTASKFELILPNLDFSDSTILINYHQQPFVLYIDKFQISNSRASETNQEFSMRLTAKLQEAPLDINLSGSLNDLQGTLQFEMLLQEIQLADFQKLLPPEITIDNSLFSFSTQQTLEIKKNSYAVRSGMASVELKDTTIVMSEQDIKAEKIIFSLENTKALIDTNINGIANADLEVEISALSFRDEKNALSAHLDSFNTELKNLETHLVEALPDRLKLDFSLNSDGLSAQSGDYLIELEGQDLSIENLQASFQELQPQTINLSLQASLDGLKATDGNVGFQSRKTLLESGPININFKNNALRDANFAANIQTLSGQVINQKTKAVLAKWGVMDLKELATSYQAGAADIKFLSLALQAIELSQHNNLPPLLKLANLTVSEVQASENSVATQSVEIDSFFIDANINAEQQVTNLVDLAFLNQYSEQAEVIAEEIEDVADQVLSTRKQGTADATPEFAMALQKLFLSGENIIHLKDKSVSPNYERTIQLKRLEVGPLDNRQPEQATAFWLEAETNKREKFSFNGDVTVFTPLPNINMTGEIREFSLPAISPYIKDSLKYEIESGQMDIDINMEVVEAEIDGKAKLTMRQVNMTPAESYKANSAGDASAAMPLNVALAVLKDRNGVVKLSVPLSGRTDQPSVGMDGVIAVITQAAILPASKIYFLGAINPLLAAAYLVDGQIKIRFQPLEYDVGQIELSETNTQKVQEILEVMARKKELTLRLCPTSVPEDLGYSKAEVEENLKLITELKALGTERQKILKDYMLSTELVESSRLLVCTPRVDFKQGATPMIKLQ